MVNLEKEEGSPKKDDKFRFSKAYWAHFKNVVEWPNPTPDSIQLSQQPLVIGVSEKLAGNKYIKEELQTILSSDKKSFEIDFENSNDLEIDVDTTRNRITFQLEYKKYPLIRRDNLLDLANDIEKFNLRLRVLALDQKVNTLDSSDIILFNTKQNNNINKIIFYSRGNTPLFGIGVSSASQLGRIYIRTIFCDFYNGFQLVESKPSELLINLLGYPISLNLTPPSPSSEEWPLINKIILSHNLISEESLEVTGIDPNWAIFSLPIKVIDFEKKAAQIHSSRPIIVTDDCQKTRWGGQSQVNGYCILSLVMIDTEGGKEVTLFVSSPNREDNQPLALFLHSTFSNQIEYLRFENGKAQLTVTAYEAFTVGAYMADGTMLELDLNRQKGFPDSFYYPFVGDVLWVDDRPELFNRGIIKSLEKRGFVFYEALSTEQAIELLQNYTFDLIISDMVRGDNQRAGMDLLKYLQDKKLTTPTVIYSSNYKVDDFRKEAIALGAKEVISGSRDTMKKYIEQFFSRTTLK